MSLCGNCGDEIFDEDETYSVWLGKNRFCGESCRTENKLTGVHTKEQPLYFEDSEPFDNGVYFKFGIIDEMAMLPGKVYRACLERLNRK